MTTAPAPMNTRANVPMTSARACSPIVLITASLRLGSGLKLPRPTRRSVTGVRERMREGHVTGPGRIQSVKALLISADPRVREWMALAVRSAARSVGEEFETVEARDGVGGLAVAWRSLPDVVVADEITSRAGAF